MLDAGALTVQVSGSGPTLFALCSSGDSAHAVAGTVKAEFKDNSGIRIFECEA